MRYFPSRPFEQGPREARIDGRVEEMIVIRAAASLGRARIHVVRHEDDKDAFHAVK